MMSDKRIEILGKIIDLLREEGVEVTSPYDIENFFEDLDGLHSSCFNTGRFPNCED